MQFKFEFLYSSVNLKNDGLEKLLMVVGSSNTENVYYKLPLSA